MVLYKTALQVGKATTAVWAKEVEGTEDSSRCCKGGVIGRRYRFDRLSASPQVRENGLCKKHRRVSCRNSKDCEVGLIRG